MFKGDAMKPEIDMQARIARMRECSQTGIIVFGPVSIKSTLIKNYCLTFENSVVHLYNTNSTDVKYFLG